MTLIGMENILKPHKGGGDVNVYKKGGAPESVKRVLEENSRSNDEEAQVGGDVLKREDGDNVNAGSEKSEEQEKGLQSIAKSETVFTWSSVRYTIPVQGGKRVLLNDVWGYVKPGRLTALVGGISSFSMANPRIWGWKDHFVELPCSTS